MGWSKKRSQRALITISLLSFLFAGLSIALIVFNLLKKETCSQFVGSFLYLVGTTFGTGLGCIWLRIIQAKRTCSHAMIHSVSLMCMLLGHREIFQHLIDGEIAKCYNKYPMSMLTIVVYIFQYLLSLNFVWYRREGDSPQRAFCSGIHAFFGALTLFVCVTDGVLACHKISRDENLQNEMTLHLAAVCLCLYGLCVWYIILNPYFDWRRLSSKVSFNNMNTRRTPMRSY